MHCTPEPVEVWRSSVRSSRAFAMQVYAIDSSKSSAFDHKVEQHKGTMICSVAVALTRVDSTVQPLKSSGINTAGSCAQR
eukprot:6564-Heterococcus_DN1.PRE.1